jgi:hypothetical protein
MKDLLWRAARLALLIAAIVSPLPAWTADVPRVELFGGYSYARGGGDEPQLEPSRNLQGFEASLAWNLGRHLGLVADTSAHFGDLDGVDLTRWFFLAGPRFSFSREPVGFFVHVLAGAVRTKESLTVLDITLAESATNLGGAAGGGIDVRLSDHWALHLQGDLTVARSRGQTASDPRSAAGLVFRAGNKH